MKRPAWLLLVLLACMTAVALWLWNSGQEPSPAATNLPAPRPPAAASSAPAGAASAPAEAVAVAPPPSENPLNPDAVTPALEALMGGKAVATYFQVDQFARRVAATVDNLGRSHAPPMLWPVHPTSGRFTVDESAGYLAAAPDNAARYTPLVLLAETVDMGSAADLYIRMYPLLQQEYRQLGYPTGHFNQRLMTVIAQLLATPEFEQAPRLELTKVKGPVPSERPWVRYQFVDPALEDLSAGQKILLRAGVVNERRLKKKLAEFRAEVAKRAQKR
jgi:hypothetical protein